jgi:hypothetical protein
MATKPTVKSSGTPTGQKKPAGTPANTATASSAQMTQAADILLALFVEVGGLVVVTIVAGISDQVANLMIVFVVGIAILWAILHYSELTGLINMLNNAEKAA